MLFSTIAFQTGALRRTNLKPTFKPSISAFKRRLPGTARALLVMALSLPIFASASVSPASSQPVIHPLLVQAATANPCELVDIIVTKSARTDRPDSLVKSLGGTVTRQLGMINAFVAQIPAGSIYRLAQAGNIRTITPDAPVQDTGSNSGCSQCIPTNNLESAYPQAVGATRLWNVAPYLQGQGVTVAVVDSGINGDHRDLKTAGGSSRVVADVEFGDSNNTSDGYGHGTHVAGIIGGDGDRSDGGYIGIAPKVNLINVKISDNDGNIRESDVIAGLEWIYNNRATHNIKVVNISLNSSVLTPHILSPFDAAVEILWFNRIVVVVAAGNNGIAALHPPANDPFVITVGAVDDRGTPSISDDRVASYSAYGPILGGLNLTKPDLVAPGSNIISTLAGTNAVVYRDHADHRVDNYYFRMSGTSMAAPVVAGAVALLLQDEPNLNPDQVKFRLKQTANRNIFQWNYNLLKAGSGYLDIYAAVRSNTSQSANTGTLASLLLWTGPTPPLWGSTYWNSVNWSSVNWSSVNWSSVNWSNGTWGGDDWTLLP
jgi:serine protease AprX